MHAGSHYRLKEFLLWTRRDIYFLTILSFVPTLLFTQGGMRWLAIPWVAVALIGTAAAFIVGFKNTQTYNRLWEARQIWGSIVNSSRTWGIQIRDFGKSDHGMHQKLIYTHFAWLTALRYQLREPRTWENMTKPHNVEYSKYFKIPEREMSLEEAFKPYLSPEEISEVLSKQNKATQLISSQSKTLKELYTAQKITVYEFLELEKRLAEFYDQQGRCERIKNFPYPRQFASINLFFIRLFVILLPFAMLSEFQKLGATYVWLTIPFSVVVAWVFMSMERVGEATENPFEGGANDVPISALSRTIEIDLREMLGEQELPPVMKAVNNILM